MKLQITSKLTILIAALASAQIASAAIISQFSHTAGSIASSDSELNTTTSGITFGHGLVGSVQGGCPAVC